MAIRPSAQEIHKNAVDHGWWESTPTLDSRIKTIPEKLCLIHSEISEALEEFRKHVDPGHIYYTPIDKKPEGFVVELADAMIRIYDLCEALGVDIDSAIALKHEFNKSRPYRHGGKRV